MSQVISSLSRSVIPAPMAGGPTTDALVVAVSRAGGLGVLATAYRTPAQTAASSISPEARGSRPTTATARDPSPAAA